MDSHTPFLISNNVCRSLGALIDTDRQEILFRKLNRTIPLMLSPKKLFMLDFCHLVAPELHHRESTTSSADAEMKQNEAALVSQGSPASSEHESCTSQQVSPTQNPQNDNHVNTHSHPKRTHYLQSEMSQQPKSQQESAV